jgi:hypothetical protein
MGITKTELLGIPDMRSAAHAIDVITHNADSYAALSAYISVQSAQELMHKGAHFHNSAPSDIAKKRAAELLMGKWKWHRCQVMAHEAADEADATYRDRARACGIQPDTAEEFLQTYYRRRTYDEIYALYDATPRRLQRNSAS